MFDPVLSPQQKILSRRLRDLANRVRWPKNRQLIWQRLLTSQQRELVEAREDVGPDIVDIWAQLHGIHPFRAALDLAYEIEAILPKEYARLVEDVEAELASEDDPVVSPAIRDGSVFKKPRRRDIRKFERAELLGKPTHETANGVAVHIWRRNEKYLARGSYRRRRFGLTLGTTIKESEAALRNMLVQIEHESFVVPSEAKRLPIKQKSVPRLSVEELCCRYVADVRARRGRDTADAYLGRLQTLIEFSTGKGVKHRWPLAASVDRDFVIEFRTFLHRRTTSRNGHPSADATHMSPRQIFNVLDCCRTMSRWAAQPQVKNLPSDFDNPFTEDLVGNRPRKDPVRKCLIPVQDRIAITRIMDEWELCQFSLSLVLPLRPDELRRLLISDVDFDDRELSFATRLGGRDFNKSRLPFRVPFPAAIEPILQHCIANRTEGPLLRRRAVVAGRKRPMRDVQTIDDLAAVFCDYQRKAKPGNIQSEQDLKKLFQRMLSDLGGIDDRVQRVTMKSLFQRCEMKPIIRPYDLRGAITTDMERAGISELALRYLTGHAVNDILAEYVAIDPQTEMAKYFQVMEPLLAAICQRAVELGIAAD
jgi:integrase